MTRVSVDIILDDAARNLVRQHASEKELERYAMQPGLVQLAFKLKSSAQEELGPPIKYHGDMQRGMSSQKKSTNIVEIIQMAPHDLFVRFGTEGPYGGFPMPVKTWASQKLGLSDQDAGAVARHVQMYGTSEFFEGYYPQGGRGFDYPEYVVAKKERDSIQKGAEEIAKSVVKYALGKAQGNFDLT